MADKKITDLTELTGANADGSDLVEIVDVSDETMGAGAGGTNKKITRSEFFKNVNITSGSVTGITDLAIADGGTGASTASDARTNLGLGDSATKNTGTTAGTVAAGDDSRITGAAQKANNLSDLTSASTARTNLGLGDAATKNTGTTAGTVAAGDDSRLSDARTPTGTASGDLTGSYPSPTLAATGTSGTYTKVTTDSKGRVASGTTLGATDIPSLTAAKISDFDTQVRTSRLDQMAAPQANVNFATFEAIALACDNGTTVPTSPTPVVGQWFLHTPTGRKVLLQYDGSTWVPIINIGSTTVYVNNTSGSDAINQGGATGSGAYKTVQYALDNGIAGLCSGNATIVVSGETYTGSIRVGGKRFTSSGFTLTIQGTLSVLDSALATTASVTRGVFSATTSYLKSSIPRATGTWTANQRANAWVRWTSTTATTGLRNEYKLIDSNTTTTLSVNCVWQGGAPTSSDTFDVVDVVTQFNDFKIEDGQTQIYIKDCRFHHTGGTTIRDFFGTRSAVTFERCRWTWTTHANSNLWLQGSTILFLDCLIEQCRLFVRDGSLARISGGKLTTGPSTTFAFGLHVTSGGSALIGDGTIFDGLDNANSWGALGTSADSVSFNGNILSTTGSTQAIVIRNWTQTGYRPGPFAATPVNYNVIWGDDKVGKQSAITSATGSANTLTDTTVNFTTLGVAAGDYVFTPITGAFARISAVSSSTVLATEGNIASAINTRYCILDAASLNGRAYDFQGNTGLNFGDGSVARNISVARRLDYNSAGNELTVQSGASTVGSTDKAGGNIVVQPGNGTGNAQPSRVEIQGPVATTSGTTDQAQVLRIGLNGYKSLTNNTLTSLFAIACGSNQAVNGIVIIGIEVIDSGGDIASYAGGSYFSLARKTGARSGTTQALLSTTDKSNASATLAVTFAVDGTTNTAQGRFQVNANYTPVSPATISSIKCTFTVISHSLQDLTWL